MNWTVEEIEQHFMKQQKLLGNLADEDSFDMIFTLIALYKRMDEQTDKLAALNRHYFFKFYNGDLEKMKADCAYLLKNRG